MTSASEAGQAHRWARQEPEARQPVDAGLPIGVARRVLQGGASLVGRVVSTPEEAASAATEGASVVLWQVQHPVLTTILPPVIRRLAGR